MLDGNDKQIDDITKKQKLIHVVKERKNEAIDTYDYDLVEKCDNLIDNLRKTVKTPDNSKKQHFLKLHQRYKEAIGQLVSLEKEKQEHFEELEKQKEEQSNSLAQQYEDELRIFNESVPNFDASNFKSSKELIEKRIDERNYALGREYEAAKKMHHIIEELEEKEKKNALYEFRKSISKQREKLGKTYEIKKEGLNSRWETLMSKETKKWDEILLVQRKKIEFLENELEDAKRKYEKQKKLDKIP
ncbi:hypothetical protein GPJ56_000754 [Histomonas meleagridis]|uniref:uncharacterized protein n=1 Tax=Histomonas meleagridis TaxID=135588 RepID=UPI003559D594|nr:hypothetical protein GPJ56_000754 [Histomonas meleagridis]KAH0804487.1 hypothetical protein GO595_003317 [Histomonas meleagridis]